MTDTEATEPEKTIDQLLGEFDDKTPEAKPQTNSEFGEVVNFVKDFQQKEVQKDINTGIEDAVKYIKSDESITASDRLVKGFLNALAEENPKVLDAFNGRTQNPAAWEEIKKYAQKEALKEFSTDTKITDDVKAAKAAASGQMTDEPPPVTVTSADLSGLSDFQFAEYKKQREYGASPEKALKSVK